VGEAAAMIVEPPAISFGDEVRVSAPRPVALGRWEVVEQHTGADGWSATLVCLRLDCGKPGFAVTVRSRVPVVDPSRLRAQTAVPPWRYRLDRLWIALAALAAALLAGAAWLARPRRVRTPLERALAAVRAARGRPVRERRRAVGALAAELRRLDRPEAQRSDRLAWSAHEPQPNELDALLEAVE
jgi:hypothetical protein